MQAPMSRRQFLQYLGLGSAAVLLAACQPKATPTPEATKAPVATAAPDATQVPEPTKGPEPLSLPIVTEPLTLSYWVQMNPNVVATLTSYNEMSCYKELEKRTGIHIDFQHAPASANEAKEQFNLMLASRKFPDVVETDWVSQVSSGPIVPGGPNKAIADGIIVRLNDLVDQYAPNLTKLLADHPDWRKQVVTDEGDLYCFPFLRGDPYLQTYAGIAVRKQWLEKVGLPMPTTIDEWHTVLKAFKEKDPNGNGQPDDIPLTPHKDGLQSAFNNGAFVGAWGVIPNFYQDGGVVKFGPVQPAFKDFVKTMASWYAEGLIDPDIVSMNGKTFDARITGSVSGAGVMNTGSGIGKYMGLMKTKDPSFSLIPAPYPVLKPGDKPEFGQRDNVFPGLGAAITTACKRLPEAVKWLDYGYGPDGHMLYNFGVEGISYTMVDGYPRYTDVVMKNPDGLPLGQAMARHFRSCFNGPFVQDRRYMEQYSALPEQQESLKVWTEPTNEKILPPITPTQDESSRFATIMNDVNTRFQEMMVKVITGVEPVESWDAVVSQLKQMGLDEATKIQQAALDRYNRR